MESVPSSEIVTKRHDFYQRLGPHNLAPLWEVLKGITTPEPKSKAVPFQWRYEDVRPLLLESSSLVSAEEAERAFWCSKILHSWAVRVQQARCMRASNSLCLVKRHRLIATRHLLCDLCLRGQERSPLSIVSGPECLQVTLSSRPRGLGTTMVTRALNRACGWTALTFRW